MNRRLVLLLGSAAAYGFAIGSVHSTTYAIRNLLKFPALIVITCAVCTPGFVLCGRIIAPGLGVQASWSVIRGVAQDLAVLLGSLATVSFFLARTIERPSGEGLGEYPLFLGLNVVFIALAGGASVVHRTRMLLMHNQVGRGRAAALITVWLALGLGVGGQWAWYLRPFFGVATIPADEVAFCMGTEPDFRGDRSFYEAVAHLVLPP